MAITVEAKKEIVTKFQAHGKDTGSSGVQIAILTQDILNLSEHLKKHRKDIPVKRTILKKVAQRKRLLSYLKRTDMDSYKAVIEALNLRDKKEN